MTVKRFILSAAFAAICIVVLPTAAVAQSSITGVVKDGSGAVMPGVTVEAASDALIEKVKSTTSDANGAYRIVDLRPGVYKISFVLPGFSTFVRDAFELPANFTATINADLRVGALEESITVSGASPVVDVQSNAKQQVLTRDVLNAVPTAGTIQGLGQLVVGVTLTNPDVGGSRAMQQAYFAVRGQGGAQTVVLVDGMMTNGMMGDGAVQAYHNEAMTQEAVYQTAGGSAETITGGVNMNLVPKDGGNQFHGGFKAFKSPADWQGNNLTQDLQDKGVRAVDKISNFYEFNIEQGGPIMKDKLWFYGAFRKARYDRPIANTFVTPEGSNIPQAFAACLANPGSCEQGVSDEKMDNPIVRLTWQASERNKIAVYMDRAMRLRGHAMGSNTDARTASVEWNTPTFATGSLKYTSTLSSKLLLETGVSFNRERYDNLYQPGVLAERGSEAFFRNVRKNDTSTNLLWNASGAQLGNYPDRYNVQGALSYVSGSHNVKLGGAYQFGKYPRYNNANGDLYQTYNNGVPFQVTVLNTPLSVREDLDANLGMFIQDSWNLNRLTLNYGIRYDYNKQTIIGQGNQVGRFANVAPYEDITLPTWSDFSPRVSAVYDISGNGKTAIRAGFNRFMTAATTGFAQLYNPTAITTQTLPWNDVNRDDIAQGERGCTGYPSVGCEINFAGLSPNFGVRSLAQFDEDLQRPYSQVVNIGITHELLPGISVAAEYYHIDFKDLTMRLNSLLNADSYNRVDVASPIDGSSIPAWVLKPEFANRVANIDSTNSDMKRNYNGMDLNFNARLPRGVRAFGGFNFERSINNVCAAAQSDPNRSLYCDQGDSGIPWQKQFKATVVYPLMYGIQVSGAWQSLNGYLIGSAAQAYGGFTAGTGFDRPNGQATYWQVTPTMTYAANCQGNCTPGALIVPGLAASGAANIQIPLVAPETQYTPRINQVDFSVSKKVQFGGISALPKIDFFNALNTDAYSSVATAQFNAQTYLQPASILQGRIIRVGVDVTW